MRAWPFVSFRRVVLACFLSVASSALAFPRAAAARQQTPEQKTEQPKPETENPAQQSDKTEPQKDAQPQPSPEKPAQKPSVPAANGRASSSSSNAKDDDNTPAPQVAVPDNDKPVIVHTDLITLTVTVTDTYGRFVTGLGQNAFTLFDDKTQQEISFFSDEDAPVSLGVVFDVSGSMGGSKIDKAREALSKFIDTSHSRDEYFLIGFNQRAQLLLDKTRDSDSLMQKLTFVQTKGQTALYDACYLGVERVARGRAQEARDTSHQRRTGQQLALHLQRADASSERVGRNNLRGRHR